MRVEYEKGYNRIEKDEDDEILLNQAIEKASGQYGRFNEAVKVIDPRKE